ncbi:hypothetical protein H2200_002756 [Cladophialophora chaetospira]|uniref:Calcineurin-like phosphoesterase domain-containing protein n=1 Tax=Cladophialophora chaetospira TaxID=386627 RepID=A0AA39CNB7_9EURO|nr:hypothetical protein H2200_002756 [Cladophialophora chaetospira]
MSTPKPPSEKISTCILIISDTHGKLPNPADHDADTQVPFHEPLPSADVLVHCGDLTMNGRVEQHEAALQLTKSVDAPVKIVIPGNHDITLDRKYYAKYPTEHAEEIYSSSVLDDIYRMYTGPEAVAAGITYLVEGTTQVRLNNGASLTVYASAYQPEYFNWAFGYPRSEDRYNLPPQRTSTSVPKNPVPDHGEVDVMITHGPPRGILDLNWNHGKVGENCGCEHLLRAVERCRPKIHAFGHIHEAWGAVRKKWDVDAWAADFDNCAKRMRDLAIMPSAAPLSTGPAPTKSQTSSSSAPASKTASPSRRKPLDPFHPLHNPSAYYMYASQASTNIKTAGETLIMPGAYQGAQVPQMCAMVDARDLKFGKETLFVNASVLNLKYQARNAPWVVDILLPKAKEEVGDGRGR